MDSNVEIAAPLVGDIGSCGNGAAATRIGDDWKQPPADWTGADQCQEARSSNIAQHGGTRLDARTPAPMDYHSALCACCAT